MCFKPKHNLLLSLTKWFVCLNIKECKVSIYCGFTQVILALFPVLHVLLTHKQFSMIWSLEGFNCRTLYAWKSANSDHV